MGPDGEEVEGWEGWEGGKAVEGWILAAGYWMMATGCWQLATGYAISGTWNLELVILAAATENCDWQL